MRISPLRVVVIALIAAFAASSQPAAQQALDGEKAFRAAMEIETVKGDLNAAIEAYRKLSGSSDRSIAAKALVRMAECYYKLGDAQAKAIYERVVRDYSDQTDAADSARARLGTTPATSDATVAMRMVWKNPNLSTECDVSADGRYVTCPAWETGDLGLHDNLTGTDRLLTRNNWANNEFAQNSSISQDGKKVAFAWFNGKDRYELRLASLTEPEAASRTIYANEEVEYVIPADWLPDNETFAAQVFRKDRSVQIGLVSTRDRNFRVLKTINWSGAGGMFVSPDGKYLGMDLEPDENNRRERDVFVLALDGSRETAAVSHPGRDLMMGWSADGKQLVFASDRGGRDGLWAIAVDEGRPVGRPLLIRPDITPASLGVTKAGALYVPVRTGMRDIHTVDVDFDSGKVTNEAKSIVSSFVGNSVFPQWSADGQSVAYVSNREDGSRNRVLVIRSASGVTKEIDVAARYFGPPRWSADGRSILLKGEDLKGRGALFKVDAATGELTLLPFAPGPCQFIAQMSPDGKKLYFNGGTNCLGRPGSTFLEGGLDTLQVREVFSKPAAGLTLSPDGLTFAGIDQQANTIQLIPLSGGPVQTIHQLKEGQEVGIFDLSWTQDGRHVLLTVRDKSQKHLLRVPIDGGSPSRVDVGGDATIFTHARLHPNGRTVAFQTGASMAELWKFENFLPRPATPAR